MDMRPLKVTITFAAPVMLDSDYPLHLDSYLAWARVNEEEEKGAINPWPAGDDLPLTKAGQGDNFVWQCSRLFFTPKAPREIINMQRKTSPDQFYNDFDKGYWRSRGPCCPTINTQSGQNRAYQFYMPIQWIERAEAWCVGDAARITELLRRVEYIGKKRVDGFGLIADIDVQGDPLATEKWKLRVLPVDVAGLPGIEYADVLFAPRAPYWQKLRRIPMREPIV